MSILIRNMEMPNRCADCPMCYDYMLCRLEGNYFGELDCIELRADWCPLVEVPPHGRLIDADAISEDDRQVYGFYNSYDLQQLLDNAPTIIESEE